MINLMPKDSQDISHGCKRKTSILQWGKILDEFSLTQCNAELIYPPSSQSTSCRYFSVRVDVYASRLLAWRDSIKCKRLNLSWSMALLIGHKERSHRLQHQDGWRTENRGRGLRLRGSRAEGGLLAQQSKRERQRNNEVHWPQNAFS